MITEIIAEVTRAVPFCRSLYNLQCDECMWVVWRCDSYVSCRRGWLLGRQTGTSGRPRWLPVQLPVTDGRRRSFSRRVDAGLSVEDRGRPRSAHQPHPGRLRHAEGGVERRAQVRPVRGRDRAPHETFDVAGSLRRCSSSTSSPHDAIKRCRRPRDFRSPWCRLRRAFLLPVTL